MLVKEEAKRRIKLGCAAAGALAAAVLIATCPIPGLSYQATAVLGILIMAIVWWITGVLPEFVTAVVMAASVGVNPWVLGFSAYALVIAWFAKYQSPIYLAAFYAVDGKMAKHSELAKYCGVYLATCLAGLVVCVPYWQWMGLL